MTGIEYTKFKVIKRDGRQVKFDSEKIRSAIQKAFIASSPVSRISDSKIILDLTKEVEVILNQNYYLLQDDSDDKEIIPTVENIQDIVERVLIKNNHAAIAKAYILYRQERTEKRQELLLGDLKKHNLKFIREDGTQDTLSPESIENLIGVAAKGLKKVKTVEIVDDILRTVHQGITEEEIKLLILNATKTRIEKHYEYSFLAARLANHYLYDSILGAEIFSDKIKVAYQNKFSKFLKKGVELKMISPELLNFDIEKISKHIDSDKDLLFEYLGVQTIQDRYLLRDRSVRRNIIELPQWMWMRIAMGLAVKEKTEEKDSWAIKFYEVLSSMRLLSSTPTLFNSGTPHSQMSSCYLNMVDDSLKNIFKNYSDCAQLSKWAGGIGTDWTKVRAKNADIIGTNGKSQGIIPFIKIYNDVALAVNQGGKRKGAMAAYLENWHLDILEFIELRKNTGDERRRAHDIHTVCYISDLFMKRVKERGKWTLFSPDVVPELHDLYGKKFEEKYIEYEKEYTNGYSESPINENTEKDLISDGKKKSPVVKVVDAIDLWKKMLTMLYETGHPWITFKDPINIRSPQDHVGVVHCSNLCTEITLNTSVEETAVCNLASLNLSKMVDSKRGILDEKLIEETVSIGMRMLDNVIDANFYPIPEAQTANFRHRPVGLGLMGYQDALYQLKIDFDSEENIEFADRSMEMISYYAIKASALMAKEKGAYSTFNGSKWDKGLLPFDTIELLEKDRGEKIIVSRKSTMDWSKIRDLIKQNGMRNSNCMAIAPTATIANIAGCVPCVEPTFKNIYMKENLSGNFIVINNYLVDELESLGMWNQEMLNKIKYYDGSILNINEIPGDIMRRFKETFEIEPIWIIRAAAHRAKWIDQSASTNIFLKTTSGKVISDTYMAAWHMGLKTTYYLRTIAASQVTKTIDNVPTIEKNEKKEKKLNIDKQISVPKSDIKLCSLDNPDCESCQ